MNICSMFPFIKLPTFSDSSISDAFCCCITCHPFGIIKGKSKKEQISKPSREIVTVSSLVDKFTLGQDIRVPRKNSTSVMTLYPDASFKLRKSFSKTCSRQTSFSYDMKHERFTPCSLNDLYERGPNDNSLNSNHQYIYKVEFQEKTSSSENGDRNHVIVAPPRRKRRNAKQCSGCTVDTSLVECTSSNLEMWKNSRNLQLNNFDQRNDNYKYKPDNINNLFNNNTEINNKQSGCSNLEIVSDRLEPNELHSRRFGSVNNINKLNNYYDNNSMEYCENKVYYKNSSFDKYGNYKHANDIDEVLVCESIVTIFEETLQLPNDTTTNSNRSSCTSSNNIVNQCDVPPENSTYTKFYTDSLYCDKSDEVSSSSSEAAFEQIRQIKTKTTHSPFAKLKAIRSSVRPKFDIQKQTGRTRHESFSKDFCGIIPTHQMNEKYFSSINPFATITRKQGKKFVTTSQQTALTKDVQRQQPCPMDNMTSNKYEDAIIIYDNSKQYSMSDKCDL